MSFLDSVTYYLLDTVHPVSFAVYSVVICVILYVYRILTTSSGSSLGDNSIDAFISSGGGAPSFKFKSADRYTRDYLTEGIQVLVLYGTEYGCSEEIAHLLYDRIKELNNVGTRGGDSPPLQPRAINMKDFKMIDFNSEQAVFIIVSTSGDGVPPTDAKECYNFFMEEPTDLSHIKMSLLALGDSNYPHFCKTGRELFQRLVELGSEVVAKQQDVDMEHRRDIISWMDRVLEYLTEASLSVKMDYICHQNIIEDTWSRNRPFMAALKTKYNLTVCEGTEDRETIHCEFCLTGSDLTWMAGDALGIYPQNNPREVDRVLHAMKCNGSEICQKPSWAYDVQADSEKMCVRDVLRKYCDLSHVKLELLSQLKTNIRDVEVVSKLDHLIEKEMNSTTTEPTYLRDAPLADVLMDFPSHTLSCDEVLASVKNLQPRYYSISSSPLIDKNTACVTAAIVRSTQVGQKRDGVTTTFLQDRLVVGETCPVFISRNPDFRLPSDEREPLILIGPGTGIAPFIAFIQERAAATSSGTIMLYFGCRHKEKDFLYSWMLGEWADQNKIILNVAFSRDQEQKVYVQDLLYRNREEIWKLIHEDGARIYVCGDAKSMAGDVNLTLSKIVSEVGQQTEPEAERYLEKLERNHRYQKDVWVV